MGNNPTWEPEDRYFVVPEIAALPTGSIAEAEELLGQLIRELRPQTASLNIDGVAVGFDDGDAIVVWER